MNKILFSLVFAAFLFSVAQEASAVRVLTKEQRQERRKEVEMRKNNIEKLENRKQERITMAQEIANVIYYINKEDMDKKIAHKQARRGAALGAAKRLDFDEPL